MIPFRVSNINQIRTNTRSMQSYSVIFLRVIKGLFLISAFPQLRFVTIQPGRRPGHRQGPQALGTLYGFDKHIILKRLMNVW